MFIVTNIHHNPASRVRIESRTTNTECIKRLALSIFATVAAYFLYPRPVFVITACISLIINLPLAYRMSREVFRFFATHRRDSCLDVGVGRPAPRRQSHLPTTTPEQNTWRMGEEPTHPLRPRPLAAPSVDDRLRTGSSIAQGAVGARNVVFVPSAAPTRSERGDGSSGQRGDTSASAPAWGSAAQPSGTTSSFQTWKRPDTTDSANLARAKSIPLSEPLDQDGLRTLQGSVGSRNTTWTRDLSDPHSVPRRTQINEENHEENGGLNIPGHGVVGIRQGIR